MFEGFREERIVLPTGLGLRVRVGGSGPPVLLLHGYPQTQACWRFVAPRLVAAGHTVVLADLRGYGESDKPPPDADHAAYSKRAMAGDQVELMRQLGFARFSLAGHDRGARVAHRLALDHPAVLDRLALLDIVPTATAYAQADQAFASAYFHWFFLIQPAPLPERLIGADPDFFLRHLLGAWDRSGPLAYAGEALDEYLRCFRDPACIAATCEDYRAAASIDLQHDADDAQRRIEAPLLVLWGARGIVGRLFDVPATWRDKARDLRCQPLDTGHFLPEEAPDAVAEALTGFFGPVG